MRDSRLLIRSTDTGLGLLLEALGVSMDHGVVDLASARIELGLATSGTAPAAGPRVELLPGPRPEIHAPVDVSAIGWATVELDRAEASLGAEFGSTFMPAARDALLGASVRRSASGRPGILLLAPDTEGRLAGALARHGEGPAALYLEVPSLEQLPGRLSIRAGSGPLGPARLILGGQPWGPFVILVADQSPASADRVPSEP